MLNMNDVTLVGTVYCEPVFDFTPGGTPVCKFIVVTEDRIQNRVRKSSHNISALGSLCDVIRSHAKTGGQCLIRGRLEYWSDDKDNRLVDVKANYAEFFT